MIGGSFGRRSWRVIALAEETRLWRFVWSIGIGFFVFSHTATLFLEFVDAVGLLQILLLPHAFGNTGRSLLRWCNIRNISFLLKILKCLLLGITSLRLLNSPRLHSFINLSSLHRHIIIIIFSSILLRIIFLILENFFRLFGSLPLCLQFFQLLFPNILSLLFLSFFF